MHFSLPKMCTLVLAKSFALLLAKKFAPQYLHSWMALSSHFPLPKRLHFSKQFAFFALSKGVIDMESKQQSKRSNIRCTALLSRRKKSKKWIKLTPKTIGNRKKRLCVRLRLGNKHHLRKSADRKAQTKKKEGVRSAHRTDLCFSICRFSQVVFIPQAQPHAQSLFLFPIVFGVNWLLIAMSLDLVFLCFSSSAHGFYEKMKNKQKNDRIAVRVEATSVHLSDSASFPIFAHANHTREHKHDELGRRRQNVLQSAWKLAQISSSEN